MRRPGGAPTSSPRPPQGPSGGSSPAGQSSGPCRPAPRVRTPRGAAEDGTAVDSSSAEGRRALRPTRRRRSRSSNGRLASGRSAHLRACCELCLEPDERPSAAPSSLPLSTTDRVHIRDFERLTRTLAHALPCLAQPCPARPKASVGFGAGRFCVFARHPGIRQAAAPPRISALPLERSQGLRHERSARASALWGKPADVDA
mmetsp:Transcript_1585/g.5068  ORF Transcript_1585/g.5068 Transcript_1585/m.5068 type:complete len:202 (-) Transcript_1585:20-625(-)